MQGLGFLTMSTPPVLAKAMGTCNAYEPECIGDGQRILFYTALALIAIGMSGHITSLPKFMAEQFEQLFEAMENFNMRSFWILFLSSYASILILIAAVVAFPYIKPWSIRFGIPAIFTVVATLIFLSGSSTYNYVRPEGSLLTNLFRVFVASASKFFHRCPKDANQLYETRNINLHLLPHTWSLRFSLSLSKFVHAHCQKNNLDISIT